MTLEPRRATRDDLPEVAQVLATTMRDDPMVTWPFPSTFDDADALTLFRIMLNEMYGELDVVWVLGEPRILAAAVWLSPAEAARFVELDRRMRASIEAMTDDGGGRYAAFWDWLGAHVPDEDCWFLDIVAVDRIARGQGLGKTMILHGLRRAHEDGQAVFLETSQPGNVPIYEHLGFRVVECADAPGGGPTIWFMRADPPD